MQMERMTLLEREMSAARQPNRTQCGQHHAGEMKYTFTHGAQKRPKQLPEIKKK